MAKRPLVNKRPGTQSDEIQAAIQKIFPLQENVNGYIIAGYAGANIVLQKTSLDGGVAGLIEDLKDNEVQYAMIRLADKKDQNDTVRDVFISWVGPQVKNIEKARKKTNDHEYMKELFVPHHAALEASSKANFNYARIMFVSGANSGTHTLD